MSRRPDTITKQDIQGGERFQGLVLDFAQEAQNVPKETGYVRLPDRGWSGAIPQRRLKDAETQVLARYDDSDQDSLPDVQGFGGIKIKNAGDMHVALPAVLGFTAGRIDVAARDALHTYGSALFESAEFVLVVKRSDIEAGDIQHDPRVGEFHTHLAHSDGRTTDMMYSFQSAMGTESKDRYHNGLRVNPLILAAPDNAVSKMGGEVLHRSPMNTQDHAMRREWGTMISYVNAPTGRHWGRYLSVNRGAICRDNPLFEDCKLRAADVIAAGENVRALETPQSLIEYSGADVTYTDDASPV